MSEDRGKGKWLDYAREESRRSRLRIFLRRVGPAGILALLAASLPTLGTLVVLGLALELAPYLREHPLPGIIVCVLGFWILGGLAFVPTWVHSGLLGLAFGFIPGLVAALLSYFGACLVGYVVAWRLSGDRVTQLIGQHPKAKTVYDALLGTGFWRSFLIITLIRITPASPFAVTNVVMGAAQVPLPPFVLGTVLGLTPRTAAVVYAATTAQQLDVHSPYETALFVAGLVAMGLAIFVIVVLARTALRHVSGGRL